MSTQEEIIETAVQAGLRQHIPFWSDSEVADALEAFAKLAADKKEAEMQERVDKLHSMYELVCQHRDMLMAQQDAMIAALRGKMQ